MARKYRSLGRRYKQNKILRPEVKKTTKTFSFKNYSLIYRGFPRPSISPCFGLATSRRQVA